MDRLSPHPDCSLHEQSTLPLQGRVALRCLRGSSNSYAIALRKRGRGRTMFRAHTFLQSRQLTGLAAAPTTRGQTSGQNVVRERAMRDVFLCDAVRTPIGRFGGALAEVRTGDLAAAR